MTDEEHLALYENAQSEWENEVSNEDNPSIAEHEGWCAENNYGVNNFGLHPRLLPLSMVRYDIGLHMVCAIVRKCIHGLRHYLDRYNNNESVFRFFDELWGNTFYSNQFRNNEVCSRIDGSHISKLIRNISSLVALLRNEYEETTYLVNLCDMLLLLPRLNKFWKTVDIESRNVYLQQIEQYKIDIDLFYDYGSKSILTNTVLGDGETFYFHVAKHHVPIIAHDTLDKFNCGVGLWTMQGFEHRNKQSKFVYSHKTNGKGNCCMQVLKGLHRLFLTS